MTNKQFLSKKAQTCLKILLFTRSTTSMSASYISIAISEPLEWVMKTCKFLVRENLLDSRVGRTGGFLRTMHLTELTLEDIYLISSPFPTINLSPNLPPKTQEILERLENETLDKLRLITLEELFLGDCDNESNV